MKTGWPCLWRKLVQAQSMLALCLFIKILLGVCLRKSLDQARNVIIFKKLLYKMCCCCDTDSNIIGHLALSERHLLPCILLCKFISWTSRKTIIPNCIFFPASNILETAMEAFPLLVIYLFN